MNRVLSFDPGQFVHEPAPEPIVQLHDTPKAWSHGIALIEARTLPHGASEPRWQQIIADAKRLCTLHLDMVLAADWSIENLFGFDPDPQHGGHGLAVALRGGRLVRMDADEAAVRVADGYRLYRPTMPNGAPLLWNFDDRIGR